ncbi:MAG: hypothetical protein ROR55_06965 [Devosia sp.]
MQKALAARVDPDRWLATTDIYGTAGEAPALREAFADTPTAPWEDGTEPFLSRYLDHAI